MTSKVGTKGQVVIPRPVRETLGIRPGDEVVIVAMDDEARVRRVPRKARLRGMLKHGASTADLEAARRRERELEGGKSHRWSG